MAKGVQRVVKNSFFQTFGAFGVTGFNFLLSVGYARFLGPSGYGSLVTSQAQVLVFIFLVDFGLSNSLIGALTSAEGGRSLFSRQGFRARDLLFRVLLVRLSGAALATLVVFLLAKNSNPVGTEAFWQDMAFTPHLFGFTLQQTGISLAMYHHRQGLSVSAFLGGVVVSVALSLFFAWQGAPISVLLLTQACGGFLTGLVLLGFFGWESMRRRRAGKSRRLEKEKGGVWGREAWKALAKDAWPYAITAGVFALWQRLDQLVVSHWLGLEAAGQYGLAVRLVGTPVLIATSIGFAIFPDIQRVGLNAPERVKTMIGILLKEIWRYGILASAFLLLCLALIVVPIVPRFLSAAKLLPFFVPGVWAFWMQSFLMNALFGLRQYRVVVRAYLTALLAYGLALPSLTFLLGLHGVVVSYDLFCVALLFFGYRAAKKCGVLPPQYLLWGSFSASELHLRKDGISKLLGRSV